MIGNGSNEIMDFIVRAFLQNQNNTIAPKYSFIAYKISVAVQGSEFRESKVDENFNPIVEDILEKVDKNTRVVYLANPNNPTSSYLNLSAIDFLAKKLNEKKVLLLLDCAYTEYLSSDESFNPILFYKNHENVMILKTFSKIYGLAGLRIGYLVANPKIISILEKVRNPFNVNSLALKAAVAALSDDDFVNKSKKVNEEGLNFLKEELKKFDLKVYSLSQTNFILVDYKKHAQKIFEAYLKKGVIIRPVLNYGLDTFLRISVGTKEENEKFLKVTKEVLS